MIFTRIRIKEFGKIRDLELEFGEGLNVVYGANEAGKTTILAFIKAMLYGLTSRKRGIRENERVRFQPWNGEFGEGELYFKDENQSEILLKRKLGNDRRDSLYVADVLTGRPLPRYYERACPGEVMLGMGEAAYMRTVYVPQLGCRVSPDKEDEIMARLMNLQQTGEEQVSLQKALNSIEKERKRITLRSGQGKLDSLRKALSALNAEKEKAYDLHRENIADRQEFNRLQERRALLQKTERELERKKKALKKHRQYQEYVELLKCQEELDSLQQELEKTSRQLQCGDCLVDEQFLQEVRGGIIDWHHKNREVQALEEELQDKLPELGKIEAFLGKFPGFRELGEDTATQVLLAEKNRETLTERLSFLEGQQKEIERLEQALEAKRSGLGLLASFYELTLEEEKEIKEKEELKKRLEEELKGSTQVDALRREITGDKLKNARLVLICGFFLLAGGLIAGFLFHPLWYLISLTGLAAGFYGFVQTRRLKGVLAEIELRLATARDTAGRKEELERISKELSAFYRRYGADNSEEFAALKRKFELESQEIAIIESRIADGKGRFSEMEKEKLSRELQETTAYLHDIYNSTSCNSLQEFEEKLKIFTSQRELQEGFIREINDLNKRVEKISTQKTDIEKTISHKLQLPPAGRDTIRCAEGLVQEYESMLNRKNELTYSIAAHQKNYRERLAGRDLAEIAAAVEEHEAEEILVQETEDEEALEQKLKELNEERLEIERRMTSLESKIGMRFKGTREIAAIEEEQETVAREIKRQEELLDILDFTRRRFIESFEELQNSFGPILNKKAGDILRKITGGKYSKMGVAENYAITVMDSADWDRKLEYFSNGTLDQVYFALRLGIITVAYDKEKRLPLILDDAFVQYDDERLAFVLEYLREYAEEHQILLFTCHRREEEFLQGTDHTFINLDA